MKARESPVGSQKIHCSARSFFPKVVLHQQAMDIPRLPHCSDEFTPTAFLGIYLAKPALAAPLVSSRPIRGPSRSFALLFRFPRRVKRANRHQVPTEQRPSSQRAAFHCFLELCHPASAVATPRRKPVWVEVGSGQQLAASAKLRGLHVSRPKCYVHETAPASFERPANCPGSLS